MANIRVCQHWELVPPKATKAQEKSRDGAMANITRCYGVETQN